MFDEQVCPFSVHLGVRGLPGVEAVDVAVVHTEGRCDQDGVVELEIGRTFGPRRVDVRARDALAIDRNLAGNVQECAELGLDRVRCRGRA